MKTSLLRSISSAQARRRRPPQPWLSGRLRLLPILIFVASLFLTVKVGLIWRETGTWLATGAIAISGAEAKSAAAAPVKAEPGAAQSQVVAQDAAAAHDAARPRGDVAAATPTPTGRARHAARAQIDEPAFTPAEVEVLRQLSARRASLDARERDLDKRDALLGAAERRLDAKAQALKDLQVKVSNLLKKHDSEEDAKMASLAKLYESMKPKDAAAILQTLELDTLLRVAERMKERKLAPIMAEMNPVRARDVTMELVRLRAINPGATATAQTPAPRPGRRR